jgi:serine phosphatase RsbU (regulator of sigma subunit)
MLLRLFCFLLFFSTAQAQNVLQLVPNQDDYVVGTEVVMLEDKKHQITFEQILQGTLPFSLPTGGSVNLGYTNSSIWLKIKIQNSRLQDKWYLLIGTPLQDTLELYAQNAQGVWEMRRQGTHFPFYERQVKHRINTFILPFHSEKAHTFYIRASGKSPLVLPIHIRDEAFFYKERASEHIGYGLYFGILLAMMIYNMFLLYVLRDRNYLYYAFCIVSVLLVVFVVTGYSFEYFWGNQGWGAIHQVRTAMGWVVASTGLFSISFLRTKEYTPKLHYILVGMTAWGFIFPIVVFFYDKVLSLGNLSITIHSLLLLIAGIISWARGNLPARFYVIAWFFYILGGIGYTLRNAGIVPFVFWTNYGVEIGSAIETLLLAFALSDRYRLIRQEKDTAQRETILLQSKANEQLEAKVQERTQELSQKNEVLKRFNDDITASIQYASRIQRAMLPTQQDLYADLPTHFVLNMPRDIVSGDFYYFQTKEEKLFLAVADCTGHGVPGALVSVVGNNLLNDIILNKHIIQPDEILKQLNIGINHTLNQENATVSDRDGMDIALCVIDKKLQKMQFAGAKNPLVYFQNGQINIIKADKMSIGSATQLAYTLHEINLNLPTTFYLFSDGYKDQFGGKEDRKFLFSQLKEILQEIHTETPEKQHYTLKKRIEDWIKEANQRQIDDIMVVGVQLLPTQTQA